MNQLKKLLALSALAVGMVSQASYATVCMNTLGTPTDLLYDLTTVFNSSNNVVGTVVDVPGNSGRVNVSAICPIGTTEGYTLRSYLTDMPVVRTEGPWQFLKLNDYLEGAMSITDGYAGQFFPPVSYKQMGYDDAVKTNNGFLIWDQNLSFRVRVTKRFINRVSLPRRPMFKVYVTTTNQDPLNTVVYTISYSGEITVPQTCEIDAGQIVEFNFGNIGAATFSDAGVGGKPAQVSEQTKNVAIRCTGVEQQALLTLRVEAQRTNNGGDIMVSDNPDVGFKVANDNGTPLTPNNISSIIPFQLDSAAAATVRIKAWPVSVTGNRPAEGQVKAGGYLRVDYQ